MSTRLIAGSHFSALLWGCAALVAVHLVGTIGYKVIGGPAAGWIDCFYMTFITVATIGYSETIDLTHSPGGRLFTVAIAFVGIGTMTYIFSTFVALVLESDLNANFKRRRMERLITRLSGHYIVCGIGRVGGNVAAELATTGREFVIIENDQAAIDRWIEGHEETPWLHGDSTDDTLLRAAGIENAAGVFAVTGDDSHNLMVALSAKLLNPRVRVVARVHDIRNAEKTRRAGADEIVSPDFTGGMRIASAMIRPHVVSFMDQMLRRDDGLRVEEVQVPLDFAARRLEALALISRNFVLVALHDGGQWVFNPAPEHEVRPGCALIVMATPDGRRELEARLVA
ncbi:MAG: potassium channel protein [Burkholderiales bacterium]|nr:potassium channel protein [Burkholderiales bacterium]